MRQIGIFPYLAFLGNPKLPWLGKVWHGEITALERESNIDQCDHHRHFHQRSDHSCKSSPRANAKYRNRDRDRQFKIIRGCRKRERRSFRIVRSQSLAHVKRDQEHDKEVDQKRNCDSHHVKRQAENIFAFEREHHHDGEQQRD